MAFYGELAAEEPSRCLVCSVVVYDDEIICSAVCMDLWVRTGRRTPVMDWEDLGGFIAQQHEPENDCYA